MAETDRTSSTREDANKITLAWFGLPPSAPLERHSLALLASTIFFTSGLLP
jgi:hypothetical protein